MAAIAPPIVRSGAAVLNRALFTKTLDLAAAAVADARQISEYRKALSSSNEILKLDRLSPVAPHPDKALAAQGRKCLVLEPGVRPERPETWGAVLKDGVQKKELGVVPFQLRLDYDYWSSHDILSSILPEEFHDDIPSGFNTAGHVAHLNLREQFQPYKKIVGQVLVDKNPTIRTVINKTHNVGTASEFRTFQYEVLAGPDDMNVQVTEGGCLFEFDYSKVYWNSKLETEHRRLINLFHPGEVVCDVMAGIGPFALPAGKRGVFVWANDLNPESYESLEHGIKKNKVSQHVRAFNQDGRIFIRDAADSVLRAAQNGEAAVIPGKRPPRTDPPTPAPEPTRIPVPPTISHYVMNLPATAITFLRHFRGVYAGREALFDTRRLPMVHVHCFSHKADDDTPLLDVCERITSELGFPMRPGDPDAEGQVAIHDVRDVAPAKRMFCASFRVPREVAFAPRD